MGGTIIVVIHLSRIVHHKSSSELGIVHNRVPLNPLLDLDPHFLCVLRPSCGYTPFSGQTPYGGFLK